MPLHNPPEPDDDGLDPLRDQVIDEMFGHATERERHLASRVGELDREVFILRQRIAELEAALELEREPRPRHDDDLPPFPDE